MQVIVAFKITNDVRRFDPVVFCTAAQLYVSFCMHSKMHLCQYVLLLRYIKDRQN